MTQLQPQIADQVLAACQAGAAEASQCLSRALDGTLKLAVGNAGRLDLANLPAELAGPGLAIVLVVDQGSALVLLPEASGLLPAWYAAPDATGKSKLTTLAQELGMLLLPEAMMPGDFQAARVSNLAEAIRRGEVAPGAGCVTLTLSSADKSGSLHLMWAAMKGPAALVEAAIEKTAEKIVEKVAPKPAEKQPLENKPDLVAKASPPAAKAPARPAAPRFSNWDEGVAQLPSYTKSLLKIRVPVTVTLAKTRQSLKDVTELGPGSIIQFDKPCDETLDLEVGNQRIAVGEAVKVGERFGLRVTSMVMPEERFVAVKGKKKPA